MTNQYIMACLGMIFALNPELAASPAVYEATNNNNFGTLDLGTGVYTQIGNMGAQLSGLAVSGSTFYGGQTLNSAFDSINTATGSLSLVGNGSFSYYDTGSTLTGLYGLNSNLSNMELFSINPVNGTTTDIGATGLNGGNGATVGLSTNCGALYLSIAGQLYTLNTTTAVPTAVGSLVNTSSIGAMVCVNGTLYGGDNSGSGHRVDTINTATGQATLGPLVTGTADKFYGLATNQSSASTPEPGTLASLIAGIAGLALILWQRTLGRTHPSPPRRAGE